MKIVEETGFWFPADVESSLSEAEGYALAGLAQDKVVLELGAWQGRSTICMGQTAKLLVSVDWHQGDDHAGTGSTLSAYWSNLTRYGLQKKVTTIIGRFEDVLPLFDEEVFDLVFLDGFHSYEQVKTDLELMGGVTTQTGVIALHDYGVEASSMGGGAFGVKKASNEMLGEPTRVVDSLAIFET